MAASRLGFASICVAASCMARAQTYQGASAIFRPATNSSIASKPVPAKPAGGDPFRASVIQFIAESRHSKPQQNVDGWLHLTATAGKQTKELLAALPSPVCWPQIATALSARANARPNSSRDQAMAALLQTLIGNRKQARTFLRRIQGNAGPVAAIDFDLADMDEDKPSIEAALRSGFLGKRAPVQGQAYENPYSPRYAIPDVVALIGEERARAFLQDLIPNATSEVVVMHGEETQQLAGEIALKTVGTSKWPQWSLVSGANGPALFLAIRKRFPNDKEGRQTNGSTSLNSYGAAAMWYAVNLVSEGKLDEALQFAKDQPAYWEGFDLTQESVDLIEKAGRVADFIKFAESLVTAERASGLLFCVRAGGDLGRGAEVLTFASKLPSNEISPDDQSFIRGEHVTALIDSGKLEEAAALLQQGLDTNSAQTLIAIGNELGRRDFVDGGVNFGLSALRGSSGFFLAQWVVPILVEEGRGPEVERIVLDSLQRDLNSQGGSTPPAGEEEIATLLRLYATAGRYQDELDLLEQAPNWGRADAEYLLDTPQQEDYPIPYLAAKALAAVGRKQEALHVVLFVLVNEPDLDPAYQLLLDVDPTGAGAILDTLHKERLVDARPLIWKAKLLLSEGQLERADALARKAISLDPQDTRAWPNATRYLAWDVLSDIELAEGKATRAKLDRQKFDNPDKYLPFRIFQSMGKIDSPISRKRALAGNPDDFWLRVQVAEDLTKSGDAKAASEQIETACDLIASQYGEASSIFPWYYTNDVGAELVRDLEQRRASNPKNGAILSVLGDLYLVNSRFAKAAESYWAAVGVDPNRLDAWTGLQSLEASLPMPWSQKERIIENAVRLEPKPDQFSSAAIRDYGKVWEIANEGLGDSILITEPVFPLSASSQDSNMGFRSYDPDTPGLVIAYDATMADFARLIDGLASSGGR